MNWTTILAEEARRNCILRSDELARRHKLSEAAVRNALRRQAGRGLFERFPRKTISITLTSNSRHGAWSMFSVQSLTFPLSQQWLKMGSRARVRPCSLV